MDVLGPRQPAGGVVSALSQTDAGAGATSDALAFPHLFEPLEIGAMTLKNRVAMAPMESKLCHADGSVSRDQIAYYRARAAGGAGLVTVEFTCIDGSDGFSAMAPQLRLDTPFYKVGHANLAAAIQAGGARACVQLSHAGRQSTERVLGVQPVAPSAVHLKLLNTTPRALEGHEIERIIARFAEAAELAVASGYDAVMLHGAHGYLLSQFLSPIVNHRDDDWGGDFERRMRFPLEVIKAVRGRLGGKPLLYRMSVSDFLDGGLTLEDAEKIAPRLAEAGVDAFDISLASLDRHDLLVEGIAFKEGWRLPMARRIRAATGKPVLTAGVIRHPDFADAAIARGDTDIVSLGRAMLTDPEWANKARAGRAADIRPCTSCNWCVMQLGAGRSVGCAENPLTGRELDPPLTRFGEGRRAVVIGGGPGGMAAALMLDQTGFEVELIERRSVLGGGLVTSASPPDKDKLFWYRDFLVHRISQSGVRVRLGETASAAEIVHGNFDAAVVATGAKLRPLPGLIADDACTRPAADILSGDITLTPGDAPVLIYGGGETGAETAQYLSQAGHQVLLVTRSPAAQMARNAERRHRAHLLEKIASDPNITVLENTLVTHVANGVVTLKPPNGDAREQSCAATLLATGLDPYDPVSEELSAAGLITVTIGDARRVARIGEAVHDAYAAMRAIEAALRGERLAC